MSDAFTLGIDLGTTNTYVAIKYKNQDPELIFFDLGRAGGGDSDELKTNISKKAQFPSIVNLKNKSAGKSAAAEYVSAIRSEKSVKRFVKNFKRDIENNKQYRIDDNEYTSVDILKIFVEDLLSQVLKYRFRVFKEDRSISKQLSELGLEKLAVTVPSAWKNERAYEKEKIIEAFLNLGFQKNDLILLYEPIAAAAYSYYSEKSKEEKRYAVIDLGGGTSDYAIVLMNKLNGKISSKIEFHGGNPYLGGKDFDESIFFKITKEHFTENQFLGKYIAEDLKIEYSNMKNDELYEKSRAGFEYSHDLTAKIDQAIHSNLDMCYNDIISFFNENLMNNSVDELLLVGGLSLFTPVFETVTSVVSEKSNKQLSGKQDNELTFCSIALGAAILAEEGNLVEEVLDKDIMMRVLIPGNMIFQVSEKINKLFGYKSIYKCEEKKGAYLLPLFKKGTVFTQKDIQSSFKKIYGGLLSFEGNSIEFNVVFDDYNKLLVGNNKPSLLSVKREIDNLNYLSYDFDLSVTANGILKIIIITNNNEFVLEESIKFKL